MWQIYLIFIVIVFSILGGIFYAIYLLNTNIKRQ